jgi:hypothetical protein
MANRTAMSTEMTLNDHKLVEDGVIATGAITLPYWAIFLNEWVALGITLGGFILVVLRILIAIREWREKTD